MLKPNFINFPIKEIACLLLTAGIFLAQPAYSQLAGDKSVEPAGRAGGFYNENYIAEIGFKYFVFDYKEDLNPPLKSSEDGWIPGIYAEIARIKPNSLFAKAVVEFSGGNVDYDGSTQTGRPVSYPDSGQRLFGTELDLGYTTAIGRFRFSPFAGYGYRYWDRGQSKTVNSISFVREEYYWHYVPVGIRAVFPVRGNVTIEPNAEARFVFSSKR